MKKMRRGAGPRNKKRSPWRLRLPLVACLGAGLVLVPANACANASAKALNPEKPIAVETQRKRTAKRKAIPTRTLIRRLQSRKLKTALRAAVALTKRRSAIPALLKILDHQDQKIRCRVLAVLHQMNWKKVSSSQKTKAAKAMFPLLMKFEPTGRSPESKIVEATLLKIGTEAMPAFNALLKSRFSILRLMALSALSQVEWSRVSPKASFKVKDALEKLKKDKIEAFRGMANELIKRINRTYIQCWQNRKQGTGNSTRSAGQQDATLEVA